MMADTDILKTYRPAPPPKIEGGEKGYLQRELTKVRTTVESIFETLKKLEARITALEP